jgi:hypothetical protein
MPSEPEFRVFFATKKGQGLEANFAYVFEGNSQVAFFREQICDI